MWTQKRSIDARISSADLVHRNGFGSALFWSMKFGDGCLEGGEAAVNAASDLPRRQHGEEALDLVQPRRAGRGEVDVPARPSHQPIADQRRLVSGVVVHDEMHVEIARYVGLDRVEELAELGGAVAWIAFADHPTGGNVEGGEERGGAVAGVVVATPRRLAWRIGSIGWLRSSAWICDFSSTQSTTAWAGGET